MNTLQQPAFRVGQQHPSSNMLPPDHDSMLQDISSHMPRSDILRQLSTHSSSTSSSSRRAIAKITKQTSASNSPHNIQRRKTTANHTTRAYPRNLHDCPYQIREQRVRNAFGPQSSVSCQRPVSWHPGSKDYRSPGTYVSTSGPAMGNPIAGIENLTVSNTADFSAQQSIQDAFAMGYGFPVSAPTATYDMLPTAIPGYGTLGPASEPAYDSYPTYSISDRPHRPPIPQATPYDAYPASSYQLPQQWSSGQSHAVNSQIPQAIPSHYSAQGPVPTLRQSKTTTRVTRKRSQELVGMGLYDDKASDFVSSLNSAVGENSNRDSLGKGLKLEETWQPPNEDEEEDDDEAYSSDEAEEVEESPPTCMASVPAEAQTSFYPAYGDLSNQSFFFNDDHEYLNDPYAEYLAFGQGLSGVQPKPQQHPGMENYLWF
jgi:hypothetical protein